MLREWNTRRLYHHSGRYRESKETLVAGMVDFYNTPDLATEVNHTKRLPPGPYDWSMPSIYTFWTTKTNDSNTVWAAGRETGVTPR